MNEATDFILERLEQDDIDPGVIETAKNIYFWKTQENESGYMLTVDIPIRITQKMF